MKLMQDCFEQIAVIHRELQNIVQQTHAVGLPKGYAFCQPLMRSVRHLQ